MKKEKMLMRKTKFKQTEIGKIPEDWEVISFEEIIKGKPRHGLYKPSSFFGEGTLIIKMGVQSSYDFIDSSIIPDRIRLENGELERFKVLEKDLLFLRTSLVMEGTGKCSIVRKLEEPAVFVSNLIAVTLDSNKAESLFYFYYFKSPSGRARTLALCEQTAAATIRSSDLKNLKIPYPLLPEQKAIARILSSLDDKIELNQQMNKTLEAIAQAIFKHWFIDFEFPNEEGKPYKSSGGEMVYNEELGKEIPKGWEVGELGSIIKITSGKRPKQKSEKEDNVFKFPLVGSSKIMGFVKEPLFREPVLVIGRVGTHGVIQRFDVPTFPSDNTLVITSPFYEYVYQILKRIDYESLNVGSTQPLITQTAIKNYRVIIPPEGILMPFEQKVSILFKKIHKNEMESKNLAKIRDALLPKLMSGEIRVKIDEVRNDTGDKKDEERGEG